MQRSINVYSTCPPSNLVGEHGYQAKALEVARWSEEHGCHGMLVYTDNGLLDPWSVAQTVIEHTERLRPLIAVQPIYMHPYTAAKKIASLAWLYGRAVDLNMLAGGFRNDLLALGDDTPHDDRYVRTTEYTLILKALLAGDKPATLAGRYYRVDKLRLTPAMPPELMPGILISGSSPAGMQAARDIGAVAVQYPQPADVYAAQPPDPGIAAGFRVGIIARDDADEAWRIAHQRFPVDRKGQLTHQLAMKVSDSQWHEQLSALGERGARSPYWMVPFENYRTFCPYLVGDYDTVAEHLAGYLRAGFSTLIVDVPREPDDLVHGNIALTRAQELVTP